MLMLADTRPSCSNVNSSDPQTARRVVVLSDIEMGAGGPTDDFPRTDWLLELLRDEAAATPAGIELVFVFNGDTFDFLKTHRVDGSIARLIDERCALEKLDRIAAAHDAFFSGLGDTLRTRSRTRAVFTTGNHDYEPEFGAVRASIAARIAAPGRVEFVGAGVALGDAWIEHGSQEDAMFRFDFASPLLEHDGVNVLRLPWGAIGIIDVMLPMHELFAHHDRMRPRGLVFEVFPELRELLVGRAWRYWSRDYLRRWWGGSDPLARVSWRMAREIVWRLGTANASLSVHQRYRQRLVDGPHRVIVIGHEHEASWWAHADRKLLTTGCLRCEFALSPDGKQTTLLPSVYAELLQDATGRTFRSELRERLGPEPPTGWAPASIFDVRPTVEAMLAEQRDRREVAQAQVAHESTDDESDGA